MNRLGMSLALLALCGGCATVAAPKNALGLNYHFLSAAGEADTAGATMDTAITAWEVTYEFLPFMENANVALSYLRRDDEDDQFGTNASIISDVFRVQARWYWALVKDVIWYVGPGLGYALPDEDPTVAGVDYSGSLYYDAEVGAKWYATQQYGVQALLNYAFLNASGDGATPDTDLSGLTVGAGVFVDF